VDGLGYRCGEAEIPEVQLILAFNKAALPHPIQVESVGGAVGDLDSGFSIKGLVQVKEYQKVSLVVFVEHKKMPVLVIVCIVFNLEAIFLVTLKCLCLHKQEEWHFHRHQLFRDEQNHREQHANEPLLKYMPEKTIKIWRDVTREFASSFSDEDKATFKDMYDLQLKATRLFKENGVRMMADNDEGGVWIIPGLSIHQEFDELERAGISPLQVLQMTTSDPADFLGRTGTMGRVKQGYDADLVILAANPLESCQNLHAICGVVRAGCYHSKEDIESLKAKALAKSKQSR